MYKVPLPPASLPSAFQHHNTEAKIHFKALLPMNTLPRLPAALKLQSLGATESPAPPVTSI